jgi:hypothetical protein
MRWGSITSRSARTWTAFPSASPRSTITPSGPSISAALLARGYGRDDVAKVMGGNVVRVLRATVG